MQSPRIGTLRTRRASSRLHRNSFRVALALAFIGLLGIPSSAQTLPNARVIEWDCPLLGSTASTATPPADPSPGALVADGNFVWFVTTLGQQRLVRFTPGFPKESGAATCRWWDLDQAATVSAAGLRLRPAGSQAFVRDVENLQRIDTASNMRTRWDDGLFSFSDVAVGPNGTTGSVAVWTTGTAQLHPDGAVQRFVPSNDGAASATRWDVGGGAGLVYLSGIDVHPDTTKSHLVYFSEPFSNRISELNTADNTVRRWTLAALNETPAVAEPRQLDVAFGGLVWVITGSGHIVRLNPTTNEIMAAPIPTLGSPVASGANNPLGIDGDGVIGFTAAGEVAGFNKVGLLFPDGITTVVPPIGPTPAPVQQLTFAAPPQSAPPFEGPATPFVKNAPAVETQTSGGTFFEVNIDLATPADATLCGPPPDPDPTDAFAPDDPCMASTLPRGIDDDPSGNVGDYFAAIGGSLLRIAHVSVPTAAAGIVSGGGFINTTTTSTDPLTGTTSQITNDKGTFGLVAMRKRIGDPVKGHVTYQDHQTGDKVISLELTDLVFASNKATIGGVCKTGSNCVDFRVNAEDNGQPNSTTKDRFEIVRDPLLGTGVADGGPLAGGNLKVRQQ